MLFNWYLLHNTEQLKHDGLTYDEGTKNFIGIGDIAYTVLLGRVTSIVYGGDVFAIGQNGIDPVIKNGIAMYCDESTNNIYIGFESEVQDDS